MRTYSRRGIGNSAEKGAAKSKNFNKPSGPEFRSSWLTTNAGVSGNSQIQLPLESSGSYNFLVKWGDGQEDIITTWNQAEVTHSYSSSGEYEVSIQGEFDGFRFNDAGDEEKLLDIIDWGNMKLGNSGGNFFGCTNLVITATNSPDLSGTTNLTNSFRNCTALTGFPDWDVSAVTNMTSMFEGVTLPTTQYSNLLIAWALLSLQSDVVFHGGNSQYNAAGLTARTTLTTVFNWDITDGGLEL